ncbi:hypothetical protein [Streptomyces antimycoticus]|uniref:hypothetical protein n=1 Tax=Streptomyces TaxID=1883 RepID=UPI0033DCD52A
MARYLVTYTDSGSETIEADNIEPSGRQYVGWSGDGSAVAYIPAVNVLSIVRQKDEAVTD